MLVTLTGAYRNAGDHLIGNRARALLRAHVEDDIVNIDRKAIKPEHYDLFNAARAVLLCGGPAYQRAIYPGVYALDYERISSPIVPYGLGFKAAATAPVDAFSFQPEAEAFVRHIHERIPQSSARDPLTVAVLDKIGVTNAVMTGCPAWYDLSTLDTPYVFNGDVKTLVLSMPAVIQPGTYELMLWLTRRFPKARRYLSFHHGMVTAPNRTGYTRAVGYARFSAQALLRGWRIASLAGSLPKMEALYQRADLHVGYRVHAHLYCLSRRIASILINEDSRGVGQATALKGPSLFVDKSGNIDLIKAGVEAHFSSRGEAVKSSVATMRDHYPIMTRFLATL